MIWLETERLWLRRFCVDDIAEFLAYASDAELRRLFGWPREADSERIMKIFAALSERDGAYAIVRRNDGRMIGHISVVVPAELSIQTEDELYGRQGATLAFAIAPEHQRKGYMTEVLKAVIDRLFTMERLDFIHCGYFAFNEASRQLQEKLGFYCHGRSTVVRYGEKTEMIDNLLVNIK